MKDLPTKGALALGTALTLSMGIAAPAFAQADSATPAPAPTRAKGDDTPSMADIIVTARRVEERLQDVPISITVFNQQQITNRNVVNSTDLAAYTPSLSTNTNFGSDNASFAIRGFVQDNGTPPSVGVYFADVVAPRGPSMGTISGDGAGPGYFFDLQNVQVLKGPQGTLQGRNTTGGAVLFVPQKPTSKLEGYLEGSYGNYGMYRVQGMLNVPLSETARFRIAVDHQQRDGYLINDSGIGPKDFNNVNYTAVRASLVVDLTPDLENYMIASYMRSDTNGSVQKMIACSAAYGFGAALACPQLAAEKAKGAGFYDVSSDTTDPYSRLRQWQIINTTTWRASDTLTLKNIASYAQFTDDERTNLFGTNWTLGIPALGVPTQHIAFAYISPIPDGHTANQSTATEELQFQYLSPDQKLTWQGGAYLEVSDPLGLVGNQSPSFIACANVATLQCTDVLGIGASAATGFTSAVHVGAANYTAGRTSYRDLGLYSQASYAITSKLKFTGGFRYTWDRQSNTATRITYLFPVLPPFTGSPTAVCTDLTTAPSCQQALTEKSSKPTWLVDLDYKPIEDVLLYAKYTRGYRAGGIFPNSPSQYRIFHPEKVDSYEIGMKSSFRAAVRGTFNIAAFYNDFSNQQLQVGFSAAPGAAVSPTTGIVNAGKSRIWGVEAETSLNLFKGFTLDASYTYLNAKITSIAPLTSSDPNYVVQVQLAAGDPLELSPKNKFSLTGTYTLPLSPDIGKVALSLTYTHTDKQLSSYIYYEPALLAAYGSNLGELPATDLVNLNASWNSIMGKPIDFSVFMTNVTNQHYFSYVAGLGDAGFESAVLGEPRMYGMRLRYHF